MSGHQFRVLYPTDQTLLAHSTELKLFGDEVMWKIIIIKDKSSYFLCILVSKACQLILSPTCEIKLKFYMLIPII